MAANKLQIEKELFEIPYNGDSIIYAPLKRVVFLANKKMVNLICDLQDEVPVDLNANRKALGELKSLGVIHYKTAESKDSYGREKDFNQPFLPANLTLFLTSDCNLACRYCYGGGGDRKVSMPVRVGLAAIDRLFRHAEESKEQKVYLSFHGGGEPLLSLKTMRRFIEYARAAAAAGNKVLTLGLTTNAVMSEKTAVWVGANMDQINVSFDGLEDIQNHQRPMRNGGNSFLRVTKTLKLWEAMSKRYSIRGTITRFSQERMPEIVTYIAENFRPDIIHLEPMFFSRRASESMIEPPDKEVFVRGFIGAEKIAAGKGVKLYFSGRKFPDVSCTFCGIGWKNFAVTPEGNVTSCFEVLAEQDARAKTFFYGKYLPGKGLSLDMAKIAALRRLSEKTFPHCADCFARFHCAGDCRAKGLYLNDEKSYRGSNRCEIIQSLLKEQLIGYLNETAERAH